MLDKAAARNGVAGDLQSLVYGAPTLPTATADDSDDELFRPKGVKPHTADTVCALCAVCADHIKCVSITIMWWGVRGRACV